MQKTVKVRIAAAINTIGTWSAYGDSEVSDPEEMMEFACESLSDLSAVSCYWITAELPIPDVQEIKGVVEEE